VPTKYGFGVPGAVEAASVGEDPGPAFVQGVTTGAAMAGGGKVAGAIGESAGAGLITAAQGGTAEDVATMALVPLAMRSPGAVRRAVPRVQEARRIAKADPELAMEAGVRTLSGGGGREIPAQRRGTVLEPLAIETPRIEPPRPPIAKTPEPAIQAQKPRENITKNITPEPVDPTKLAESTGFTPERSPEALGVTPAASAPDPINAVKALKRGVETYRGPTKKGLAVLRRKRGGSAVAEVDVGALLKEYKAIDSGQRTPEQMHTMYRAMRGEVDPATLSKPQRAWVNNYRRVQDRLSKELVRELRVARGGETLLSKRVEENIGQYVRETLVPKGPGEKVKALFGRENRLRSEQFKRKRDAWTVEVGRAGYKMGSEAEARQLAAELRAGEATDLMRAAAKDHLTTPEAMLAAMKKHKPKVAPPLTEAERIDAGFSRNPMYTAAVSIMDTAHNVEMLRMARTMVRSKVAKAPPEDVLAGGEKAIAAWAKENGLRAVEGDVNRIGMLQGTYAPKRIAAELNELTRAPKEWERIWRTYLDAWKTSKTVLNPPTHARNMLGNIPFADMADVSPMNPANWTYYKGAVGEIRNRGPAYRYLLRQGVIGGEYVGNEVRRLHPIMDGSEPVDLALIRFGQKAVDRAGRLYNAEDQIYKLAAYLKYRDRGIRGPWKATRRGASAKQAAREANLWFPNYGAVSRPFKKLARTPLGGPFLSFMEQATRIAGRAAVRRPLKVMKWLMFPEALTAASVALLGMEDDELNLINQDRSWWEPILPLRDGNGAAATLDLRYTIPLAQEVTNLVEFAQGKRHAADLPIFLQQALPESMAEVMMNTQRFTRREVFAKDDTLGEKVGKSVLHVLHGAAPYPTFLDYGRERLQRAFVGVSDESVPRAMAGALLGIGVRKPYIARREAFAALKGIALEDAAVKQVVDRLLGGDVRSMDYDTLTGDLEKNERFQDLLDLYNEVYRRTESGPYMDRGKLSVGERIEAVPRPYGASKADEPATERGILASVRRDVSKQQREDPTERVTLRKQYEATLKDLRKQARLAKARTGPALTVPQRKALRTMEAYERAIKGQRKRLSRRRVSDELWDATQRRIDDYMTKALRAADAADAANAELGKAG
jgi:hypothetical protein